MWLTIEQAQVVLCRVKLLRGSKQVMVKFLTVAFHFRKMGVATYAVRWLKARYPLIIAQDVKPDARAFWERMGFSPIPDTQNYTWPPPPHSIFTPVEI